MDERDEVTVRNLTNFLRKNKSVIIQHFAGARPYGKIIKRRGQEPKYFTDNEDNTNDLWLCKKSALMFCMMLAKSAGYTELRDVCRNKKLLYAMRVTAYILEHVWCLNESDRRRQSPLGKCVDLLISALSVNKKGWTIYSDALQYAHIDHEPKFHTSPSIERYAFFHILLTKAKRTVGTLLTNLVATRWEMSLNINELMRRVNPDINHARRVAISVQLLNEITELPLMDIVELINHYTSFILGPMGGSLDFSKNILERAGRTTDADMLFILSMITDAGRGRFKNKFIEVNERDCTCHTKCVGRMGRWPRVQDVVHDKIFKIQLGMVICGFCRLSLSVENTTSQKPRRCINAKNPIVSSCSLEGCTSLKHVPLYQLDVVGPMVLKYSHRFYSVNPKMLLEEVYQEKLSTTQGRVHGVCFSGSRKCVKKFNAKTSIKQLSPGSSYTTPENWARCSKCDLMEPINVRMENIFLAPMNKGTCIAYIYKQFNISGYVTRNEVLEMCRGCRAAILCRHVFMGFVNNLNNNKNFSINNIRRLRFIANIQNLIRKVGF